MVIWRRLNCFKEGNELFTFNLMVRGKLKAKQWSF
ncbi:hypothetical protein AMTRI_Chr06g196860 [Amborella trichopoda]